MRKTTLLILSVLVVASMILAACSAPKAAEPVVEPATEAPVVAEEPTQEPAVEEQIVLTWLVLEFWNPDNVIAAYEAEHPNIKIEAEKVGWADLFQQIQIRLAAGDGSPDLVTVDGPLVASYGARGWLYPLDDAFSAEELANGWVPGAVEAGTYNGQFLAAPQHTSTQLLYYNKALFDAAGITPPGENERWTWEQVSEAAKAMTQGDVYGFHFQQPNRIYQLQPMIESLGGEVLGADGFTVDGVLNSPEWIQALTFYSQLYNEWGVSPKSDTPGEEMFANGKLAMFLGGTHYNLIWGWNPLGFEWGVSRHPYFEGGEVVTPTGGFHFGVNASSAHPEEAAAFLRWLSVGEGASIWWGADSFSMPAQTAILDTFATLPEFDKAPLSYMKIAYDEAFTNPVPRPVTPGYLEYEQLLMSAFDDIRNGADVTETLNTAIERITEEMQKYQR